MPVFPRPRVQQIASLAAFAISRQQSAGTMDNRPEVIAPITAFAPAVLLRKLSNNGYYPVEAELGCRRWEGMRRRAGNIYICSAACDQGDRP